MYFLSAHISTTYAAVAAADANLTSRSMVLVWSIARTSREIKCTWSETLRSGNRLRVIFIGSCCCRYADWHRSVRSCCTGGFPLALAWDSCGGRLVGDRWCLVWFSHLFVPRNRYVIYIKNSVPEETGIPDLLSSTFLNRDPYVRGTTPYLSVLMAL